MANSETVLTRWPANPAHGVAVDFAPVDYLKVGADKHAATLTPPVGHGQNDCWPLPPGISRPAENDQLFGKMEARVGIEPAYTALQAAA